MTHGSSEAAEREDLPEWSRVQELFLATLEADAPRRAQLLEQAPSHARAEVERMLAADAGPRLSVEQRLLDIEQAPGSVAAPSELAKDTRVGSYRVLRLLGFGGMGQVYLACRADRSFERHVAIKVLASGALGSAHLHQRFERERRILAQLDHPGIAGLLDGGTLEDGRPYLVMEFVDGNRLTEFCDERRLSVRQRLELVVQVCAALQHAHQRLVIHRDLKPDNILVQSNVDAQGTGSPTVKLLDFGIAKLLEPEALDLSRLETQARQRPMTPRFAAPEQFSGQALTTATDVYALGVVLCLLLTGRTPFGEQETAEELESQVRTTPAPRLTSLLQRRVREEDQDARLAERLATTPDRLARTLRGDLQRIVGKALSIEPERRYASAGDLGRDLSRYLNGEAVEARDDTTLYRLQVFWRRNRLLSTVVVGSLLALSALSGVLAVQTSRARRANAIAEEQSQRSQTIVGSMVDLFASADARLEPTGETISVVEFLRRMERVADAMSADPQLHAQMLQALGEIYEGRQDSQRAMGVFDRALTAQQRAVERALGQRSELGAMNERLLQIELAAARSACLVDSELGIGRLRKAVARHEELHGDQAPAALRAQVELADCLAPGPALEILEAVTPALASQLGGGHRDVVRAEIVAAQKHSWAGDHERARTLLRSAADNLAATLGEDHPETLFALQQHAAELPLEEGLVENRELLERQRRVFGDLSAQVGETLDAMGVALIRLGSSQEAVEVLERSLEVQRSVHGETSMRFANTARNLGMVNAFLGHYDEAAPLLQHLEDHAGTERTLFYGRGQLAFVKGRIASQAGPSRENREQLLSAIDVLRESAQRLDHLKAGPADRYPLDMKVFLARLYLVNGDAKRAAAEATAVVEQRRAAGLPEPRTVEAALVAARAALRLGDPTAGPRLEELLARYEAWGAHERLEATLARRDLDSLAAGSTSP